LYKKAAAKELPNLTGVGQEYEPPGNSDLVLDGTSDPGRNVEMIMSRFI
jgi:adenylylsulfate kinase-like enzyme